MTELMLTTAIVADTNPFRDSLSVRLFLSGFQVQCMEYVAVLALGVSAVLGALGCSMLKQYCAILMRHRPQRM
jgi:hypothetical protein